MTNDFLANHFFNSIGDIIDDTIGIFWEESDFVFDETKEWTEEETGKTFTDYYFTISNTEKRKSLLKSVMEQSMQNISRVIVNLDKQEVILQVQYVFNVSYVPCNDKLLYNTLSYIISKRENRHILSIKPPIYE